MTREPDKFESCHAVTHNWERGYSNHPRDPGGATQDGVTQAVYDAWRRSRLLPLQPVRISQLSERTAIFRAQYWNAVRGDELPFGIDLAVYDFAVNSGAGRAIRHLQAALGVKVDGHLGEVTLRAARDAAELGAAAQVVDRIMTGRADFLKGLSTWGTFGKGWSNRLEDVGRQARRMTARNGVARMPKPGDAYGSASARPTPPQDAAASSADTLTKVIVATGTGGAAAATQTKDLFGDLIPEWALAALLLLVIAGVGWVALHHIRKTRLED